MPVVTKRILGGDGEVTNDDRWHHGDPSSETPRILCTGEAIDEDSYMEVEHKEVKRGGITCEKCLAIIKQFKAIKL